MISITDIARNKVKKLIQEAKIEISKISKDVEKLILLAEFVEYRKN